MVERIFCTLLCVLTMSSWAAEDVSLAEGQPLIISSGVDGGGYWSAASRLQTVVEGRGTKAENVVSTGSLANLEALTNPGSPVNLAFAQADALEYFLHDNPGARAKLDVLENIGQECVFIITSANGKLLTDTDLQNAEDYRLGIPSDTSGVAVTFNYMTRQIPELSSVQIVYGDTAEAIADMHSPAATLDAVMVVHRPREHSREVDLALGDSERYRFLEIDDNRLTGKSVDGQEVYKKMKLAMSGQDEQQATTVNTICVKGLLLANKEKLTSDQQKLMIEVVNYQWMEVFATQ